MKIYVEDNTEQVLRRIKRMTNFSVVGGVVAGTSERVSETGDAPGITNADIGYINEFGDAAMNVPARPHLIPAADGVAMKVAKKMKDAVLVMVGYKGEAREELVEHELNKGATLLKEAIKDKIKNGPFKPLSPVTLRERRRVGITGTDPLQATGQYYGSIEGEVRYNEPEGGE